MGDAEKELLARRREIAQAAIAIADEEGIDAVSMRNIATRLEVGTMTLYTWVESKDDLIGVMSNALAEQMLVPEPIPDDWREALTLIATATRDVFAAHPWMLSRDRPIGRLGANMLRHVDQSVRAVSGLDLDWQTRTAILQAVDHYAIGYAIANKRRSLHAAEAAKRREATNYGAAFEKVSEVRAVHARQAAPPSRADEANAIELREAFASGELPALTEYFGSAEAALARMQQGPPTIERGYEDGLEWLLDGIAAMLDARNSR